MKKRKRMFMTRKQFYELRIFAKRKVIVSKKFLLLCLNDCLISLSSANVKVLGKALADYEKALVEFRCLPRVFARSRDRYLSLKEQGLLSKEELELYDSEFCD